jgi:hypothetical protein
MKCCFVSRSVVTARDDLYPCIHEFLAIAMHTRTIEASPKDADLRQQRASLLEQVGLTEAAEADNR